MTPVGYDLEKSMFTPSDSKAQAAAVAALLILWPVSLAPAADAQRPPQVHTWQMHQIELRAEDDYSNPYTEVFVWVDLTGPDFSERIYGFWDGGSSFKIRVVATAPGRWQWQSGSNQPDDRGLNGKQGDFVAVAWTEEEKRQNPNRRGFLRPTPNGHALQYADGTPFFLVGDTWWAASTWRLPLTGKKPAPDYTPAAGITFEEAVAFRKRQGYNLVNVISAFPNWDADHFPSSFQDAGGVVIRSGWEKFGVTLPDGRCTIKDMHDQRGYRPFELLPGRQPLSDFDRVVPQYFKSLDEKVQYLNDQGFIAMLETVRRDIAPSWKAYFDFNESYARFIQYIASRYGAFNLIFSRIHLDAVTEKAGLSAEDFNAAITHHFRRYGPMPFGQPVTTLINESTYIRFGHGEQCPWLTLHSQGNRPRDHGAYANLEEMFHLEPPYPAINLEPYYAGWMTGGNSPAGERPPADCERDVYFARAQMYGNVLSGALAGHVYGHAGYDMTAAGEPEGVPGARPFFWEALNWRSGAEMQHLKTFVLSEGGRFQDLLLASDDVKPRRAPGSPERGLDGWAFMMRAAEKDFALLYFERAASRGELEGMAPGAVYEWRWFDPREGRWSDPGPLQASADGRLVVPAFPDGADVADDDWAARIVRR